MDVKHWWTDYPWRMIQTNLRETDMADIDAEAYAQQLADYGATVVTLNAAGIIASYQTKLDFQTQSPYLTGSSLMEIIEACHKRGIRVIARTDFQRSGNLSLRSTRLGHTGTKTEMSSITMATSRPARMEPIRRKKAWRSFGRF